MARVAEYWEINMVNKTIELVLDDFDGIEEREARYMLNMHFKNYSAAEYELVALIKLKSKIIMRKHCE